MSGATKLLCVFHVILHTDNTELMCALQLFVDSVCRWSSSSCREAPARPAGSGHVSHQVPGGRAEKWEGQRDEGQRLCRLAPSELLSLPTQTPLGRFPRLSTPGLLIPQSGMSPFILLTLQLAQPHGRICIQLKLFPTTKHWVDPTCQQNFLCCSPFTHSYLRACPQPATGCHSI